MNGPWLSLLRYDDDGGVRRVQRTMLTAVLVESRRASWRVRTNADPG
jgi:hypothetical protein